jgi:hypothetical protein
MKIYFQILTEFIIVKCRILNCLLLSNQFILPIKFGEEIYNPKQNFATLT